MREIRFNQNQISTIKAVKFSQLKSLEILDLGSNKIPVLDVVFPISLSSLLLSNNSIVDLPTQLISLSNLQTLQLTGKTDIEPDLESDLEPDLESDLEQR